MSGTTTHFAIPYPEEKDNINEGATKITEALEKIDKLLWERPLNIAEHGVSFAATSGLLVKCTGAITVTSPAAANDAIFGVLANGHAVTIKTATGKIYGDFTEGATEVNLVGYQHLILMSDGTNWFIISGEPKREAGIVKTAPSLAETEAGIVPSTTRRALVTIFVALAEKTQVNVWVGGTKIGVLFKQNSGVDVIPVTVETFPGEAWQITKVEGVTPEFTVGTRLL